MTSTTMPANLNLETARSHLRRLGFYGLLAQAETLLNEPWLVRVIEIEDTERARRSLKRRLVNSRLGAFKPIADFDWDWPEQCDKAAVSELMTLAFINHATNIVLVGPNGIGKSTIAQNIVHHAVMQGHTSLFVNAAQMLGDLAAQDGDIALRRRLRHYARPALLAIDEIGYLSYANRHADLLFEIINRRYESKPTIVTTNRPFTEWNEVFPNAACVVSIVDRLIHHSEIIVLEGESYRIKEAKERASKKKRSSPKSKRPAQTP